MKLKILTLLLSVIVGGVFVPVNAQTEININANSKNYSQIFDSLSAGLIPSRIPYGVLYNRSYGWSGLDKWQNGDTTSIYNLFQNWYDTEQSYIDSTQRPNRYTNMRRKLQQKIYEVKLPIIALNYTFSYFDSLAFTDGRVTVSNGMLIDNNLASPYLTKQIGIAGFGLDKLIANKNYSLQLDTALIFINSPAYMVQVANNRMINAIQNITINNLTTGLQYSVTSNNQQLIQFNHVGINVIKFTISTTSGASFIVHQIVTVEDIGYIEGIAQRPDPNGPTCFPSNELIESTIPFQGYGETIATNSFADYHIYYHTINLNGADNCQRILKKPIIIMDGFDPQDDNKYIDIYKKYLKYTTNGVEVFLGDDLRDKGYDVIILNFPKLGSYVDGINGVPNLSIPTNVKVNGTTNTVDRFDRDGGTDYMERNAFILVKLIQQVNATLLANGSTEKLVVIGPSMGGQISRYALAYMEKQQNLGVPNMNHNTRLFLSFDSPNDGANIPLALAHNLDFFGNFAGQQEAKEKYDQKLHSIAARQLLIEQLDGLNSSASFHQTFFNNIRSGGLPNSGGYPTNLRKVALLNGNGNSIKTYNDGDKIFNMHGVKSRILAFIADDNFMPYIGSNLQIARTRLFDKNKPIWNSVLYNSWYSVTNQNARGSMDVIQGSTFDANKAVYDGFVKSLKDAGIDPPNILSPLKPNHCFIPSISALGFKNSNFNWNTTVTNRNLVCNNEIYFNNYFIPSTNEEHITLTTKNVEWLTQEIDRGQPNCPPICTFSLVGNSSNICIGSYSDFTFDVPVPSGYTVTWDASNFNAYEIITSSSNGITIKGLFTGNYTITAHIINPCGADAIVKRNIYIIGNQTKPSLENNGCNGSYGCESCPCVMINQPAYNNYLQYTLTADLGNYIPNNNDWEWEKVSGNFYFYNYSATSPNTVVGKTAFIYLNGSNPNGIQFRCRVKNDCVWGPWRDFYWYEPQGGRSPYTVSPNPSSSTLKISQSNNSSTNTSNYKSSEVQEVELSDKMGVVRFRKNLGKGLMTTDISVSNLPNDIYTLRIFDGVSWHVEKVIIQH